MKVWYQSITGILILLLVVFFFYWYRIDVIFSYEVYDLTNSGADTLKYRFFKPADPVPDRKYPLVVYLHGSSNRGNDNSKHVEILEDFLLSQEDRKRYPCYVFAPQCKPHPYQWVGMRGSNSLLKSPLVEAEQLVLRLIKENPIDTSRIYLIGYSMGAAGAWESMIYNPDLYAAAAIVSGWGIPSKAAEIREIPVWVFHGTKDKIVNPKGSRQMVKALKKIQADISFTEYKNANHETTILNALEEKQLLEWLFSQGTQE